MFEMFAYTEVVRQDRDKAGCNIKFLALLSYIDGELQSKALANLYFEKEC